ncbi:hypothetical protein SAMN06265377_1931 [Flagellimonas pacifica]|uniref:Uncharacterized protein n=1 Tax=Flagellimonas pacifica TaxID=1247520 RepID=A0A285MSE9_9FLAO|nr:hypothetical protein SAMN06265377_1931 [Allomuricauda parva]
MKKFNYGVNLYELELQSLNLPSYPSLHSVTELFNRFDIENIVLEGPKTLKRVSDINLECP